jgi:hypothetical protein
MNKSMYSHRVHTLIHWGYYAITFDSKHRHMDGSLCAVWFSIRVFRMGAIQPTKRADYDRIRIRF